MFLERHDQFWKHIWRDRGNCAHRHLTGDFALELINATTCVADGSQNLPGVIDETSARLRQDD